MRALILFILIVLTLVVPSMDVSLSQTRKETLKNAQARKPPKKTLKGEIVGYPPKSISRILRSVSKTIVVDLDKGMLTPTFNTPTEKERLALNDFASQIAGGLEPCKVLSFEGCGSCYLGNTCRACSEGVCGFESFGNLVHVLCRDGHEYLQCWRCAREPC